MLTAMIAAECDSVFIGHLLVSGVQC
jgi:hypothetical protein